MDTVQPENSSSRIRELFTIYEGVVPNSARGDFLPQRVNEVAMLVRRNEADVNSIEAESERKLHQSWAEMRNRAVEFEVAEIDISPDAMKNNHTASA